MGLRRIAAVCAMVFVAGCASTAPDAWTEADNKAGLDFRAERRDRAAALEREGDQVLASGSPERALERYTLGLKAVGLRGRFGFEGKRTERGWEISKVAPDLPAARAGLRPGDVLVRIRGVPAEQLGVAGWDIAFKRDPGDPAQVGVLRGGGTLEMTVVPLAHWWDPPVRNAREDELIRSLRFKAAAAAGRARALPAIPQAARGHAARAQAQARTAKTRAEFETVSDEFRAASLLAPWWSDLYINYALFQEATEDAIGARESLALYLESRPNAADRAAVGQKQAALAGKAEEQRQLMAWEGFWGQIVNGRRTTSGIEFERRGRLLMAKNNAGFEWLRGTVVDEYTAKTVQRFGSQNAGHFAPVIQRCFNGMLELPGTMKLAPDKQQLTITMADFNVDPSTCRVQSNSALLRYGR